MIKRSAEHRGRCRRILGVVSGSRPGRFQTLAQAACRSVAAAPLVIRRLLVLAASSPPFRLRLHVLLLDASSSSPAPPPPSPPTQVAVLRSRSSGCSGQVAVVSSQWSARNGQLKCSACIHRLTVLSTVSSHSSARLHGLAVVGSQSSACTGCLTVLGLQLSARDVGLCRNDYAPALPVHLCRMLVSA